MAKMQVDQVLIRELALLLDETNLSEIEVEEGDRRIRVARNAGPAPTVVPAAAPAPVQVTPPPADAATDTGGDPANHPGAVPSPMVGTTYLSPEPGAAPFVTVGSEVKAGQTILIIEAMKVMNSIAAPHGGTVRKILVADAQPVEFGEALMIIE